jgi:hypothetical protein
MVLAPQTRRGTIHTKINHKNQPQFVFRLDPRFDDHLREFFINEGDVVECLPPSDAEVAAINAFVKKG